MERLVYRTMTQGLHEITFITNKKYEKKILKIFPKNTIKKIIKNLSGLTVRIPIEAISSVGLFYIATRALNWENINIVEIVSTLTELTFIISEEDTVRSFAALKELIGAHS